MKKIHLLIGLPGSGKTFWLNQNAPKKFTLDDISQIDPYLEKLKSLMSDSSVSNIWISDFSFCNFKTLQKSLISLQLLNKKEQTTFTFLLFKTPLNICLENIRNRKTFDNRSVHSTIHIFSKTIDNTFEKIEKNFLSSNIISIHWNKNIPQELLKINIKT